MKKRNKMFIWFVIYASVMTIFIITKFNSFKREVMADVREYHSQSIAEINKIKEWTTGEYPQWFIEWENSEFYGEEAKE